LAALVLVPFEPTLIAQGQDPTPPPGGFALQQDLNQIVTYSDNARTYVDVRYPQVTPGPPSGWPVIVLVHGLGGSKSLWTFHAQRLARLGYLTVAFDYRGQGQWFSLNPPGTGTQFVGEIDRLDLVDLVAAMRQRYGVGNPPKGDFDRAGITGWSQGGLTSWAAAAWSGKPLPKNSRNLTRFPVFKAAFPWMAPAWPLKFMAPQDKAFVAWAAGGDSTFDPATLATKKRYLLNEDFAGLNAWVDQDPFRQDHAQLATSQVPVYAHVTWNDYFWDADPALRSLAAMPASTPKRLILDTADGHGDPTNLRQQAFRDIEQERWFARFLKGVRNGVDQEPMFISATLPASSTRHLNMNALFWNRYHDAWPPPATDWTRYYLRNGQTLQAQAPTGAEPADRISHQVNKNFDINAYVNTPGDKLSLTLQNIPLSSLKYDSPPLAQDAEIAGAARVHLEVTPTTKNFQVHCAVFQLSPSNPERFLGSGFGLVRAQTVQPVTLDVNLIPLEARLKKGDRIRLRLENLTYRRTDKYQDLWLIPYFESTQFNVEHSKLKPSWIDLPLRRVVQPALSSATLRTSVSSPANVSYTLEAPNHAGDAYILLLGGSGISPSTPLPGSDPVRLAYDPLTQFSIGVANTTLLPGSLGTLDSQGSATIRLQLQSLAPLPSALHGFRLNAVAAVTPGGAVLASNPVDLYLQ